MWAENGGGGAGGWGAGRMEGKNEKAPDNLKVKQTVYCRFIVRYVEDFCLCLFVTAATQRSSARCASSIYQCVSKQKKEVYGFKSERSEY